MRMVCCVLPTAFGKQCCRTPKGGSKPPKASETLARELDLRVDNDIVLL